MPAHACIASRCINASTRERRGGWVAAGLMLLVAKAAMAQSYQFAPIPTISATTTLSAGHVCATDGRDIYCDGTLPLSAGLGINDRIVSGSQAMMINSATGVVSLSTAGMSWGYLSSNISYLPQVNSSHIMVNGGTGNNNALEVGGTNLSIGIGGSGVGVGQSVGLQFYEGGYEGAGLRFTRDGSHNVVLENADGTVNPTTWYGTANPVNFVVRNGAIGVGFNVVPSATLHVSGTELVTSNSNVLGEVSASTIKVAMAAGVPSASLCVNTRDYGRIVQGSDNRLYLCTPR